LIGSGPHGGLLVLWLNIPLGELPKHIFRHPFTKLSVTGKQPAPLIQRRAVCKPTLDGGGAVITLYFVCPKLGQTRSINPLPKLLV